MFELLLKLIMDAEFFMENITSIVIFILVALVIYLLFFNYEEE